MLEHMGLLEKIERAQRSMIAAENIAEENLDKLEEFILWHIVPGNDENQRAIAELFTEIRNRDATVENGCITFKNDNDIKVEVEVIQQSSGRVLVIIDINRPCGLLVIGKDSSNPTLKLRELMKRRDFTPQTPQPKKQPLCTEFVQAGIECKHCIYYVFGKCELTMLERGELQ